ncbi:DNA polymerase-3 subunit epsilon [Arcticibacter pallidicorallinus]|uniref:DNA polymerase-3 subunit epsilon n=1 Tax=Arcticibacter pallidicorallinus TaxID=1259464 RepID=A0A2T0U349_9SPHI|nr:3'-5' exonuclease [Arcticibacter pallidicorallinus]PRY52340.1 DNA polymerase-3 subunit epsilon [Arcticibacter pallidicorallinus]
MNDYYLFIDTETSGLPKRWDRPYSKEGNWPHIVQISWVVYSRKGEELLQKDHFINDEDFVVSPGSFKIHGFSDEYRKEHGKSRLEIMKDLSADLSKYKPIIVGHFTELDLHMIGADYYRARLPNMALCCPAFCTMMATVKLVRNPSASFLKLGQLYELLFNENLRNPHNALDDSIATARCFFELEHRGLITGEIVASQQGPLNKVKFTSKKFSSVLPVLFLCLLTILITFLF